MVRVAVAWRPAVWRGAVRRVAVGRDVAWPPAMRRGAVFLAAFALAAFSPPASASPASVSPASPASASSESGRAQARFALTDDWGRTLRFDRRPARIVSLAPHATELLFAAGAGDRLVAADLHSDHPQAARAIPRVTSHPAPDPEQLLALRPDLVVIWGAAASADRVARLEALGLTVFVSDPRTLEEIAGGIERFSSLSDDPAPGLARAQRFRARVAALRARNAGRAQVPVFVQAWSRPLLTLSDRDAIGDALRSCGARNVFGAMAAAAPQVGPEAVLAAAPRLIVAIGADADPSQWEALRLLRPQGPAAFARIDPVIQRPTERMLPALERLCEAVEAAR